MNKKQKRFSGIFIIGVVLMAATTLVLFALRNEIRFFYSPKDIYSSFHLINSKTFRLGGLVKNNSLLKDGTEVKFKVTDGVYDVSVIYNGILPDLFREGQGVIAEGILVNTNLFVANTVLARHDENYIPKEIADIKTK